MPAVPKQDFSPTRALKQPSEPCYRGSRTITFDPHFFLPRMFLPVRSRLSELQGQLWRKKRGRLGS